MKAAAVRAAGAARRAVSAAASYGHHTAPMSDRSSLIAALNASSAPPYTAERTAQALALCERLLKQTPDDLDLRAAMGSLLARVDRWQEALPHPSPRLPSRLNTSISARPLPWRIFTAGFSTARRSICWRG